LTWSFLNKAFCSFFIPCRGCRLIYFFPVSLVVILS
jgi:hypothetical protein